MPHDLTHEDLAQLATLGPTRYKQAVISLFASGEATPEQWQTLTAILTGRRLRAELFRDRCASTYEWVAMSQWVLACSESGQGRACAPIDRAVLARLRRAA